MALVIAPAPEGLSGLDSELAVIIINRAEALHRAGLNMTKDHRRAVAGVKRLINEKYRRQVFPELSEPTS